MPHFIVEYTDNIKTEARISELLAKVNKVLMAQSGVFPTGGIRSRAIELTDYRIADSAADYAFVHASFKIGSGRTDAEKKKACDELFAMMCEHFAELFAKRYLALSLEFGGVQRDGNL